MKLHLHELAFLVALTTADSVPAQMNSFAKSTKEAEPVKTDTVIFEQRTSAGIEPPPPRREDKDGKPRQQVKPVFIDRKPPLRPVDPRGSVCCQSGTCNC